MYVNYGATYREALHSVLYNMLVSWASFTASTCHSTNLVALQAVPSAAILEVHRSESLSKPASYPTRLII